MVGALNKLRSIAFGAGAHRQSIEFSATTSRVRDHRDVALLVHHNGSSLQCHSKQREPLKLLTEVLSPLEDKSAIVAGRLLERFGTLSGIATASETELRWEQKRGETWAERLIAVRQLITVGVFDQVQRTDYYRSRASLCRYLLLTMGGLQSERLVAFFLDSAGSVIAEAIMAEGQPDAVTIPIRPIAARALSVGARGIVLAHNHPSGIADPSKADIANTLKLRRALRDLEVVLVDHLIVGQRQVTSMKDEGCI